MVQLAVVEACRSLLQREAVNYALLDAARDPAVRAFVLEHAPNALSLYAGIDEDLVDVAPYLMPLTDAALEALLPLAWGNSWGIFLSSEADIDVLRRHFRQFLMVELEDGEEVYFRFYDPRVLRAFVPTCTPDEARQLFGSVDTFFMEADDPTICLRFDARADVVGATRLDLKA